MRKKMSLSARRSTVEGVSTTPSSSPSPQTQGTPSSQDEPSQNAPPSQEGSSSQNPPPTKEGGIPPLHSTTKTSEVWSHFTKTIIAGKGERAVCMHCKSDLASNTQVNGTSSLLRHLRVSCPKSPLKVASNQKVICFDNKNTPVSHSFNKDTCRRKCVEMLIIDELPFKHVEGIGFKRFMKEAQPKFEPPSRRTVARDVWSIFQEEKAKIKSVISQNNQRVSLTTDTWTSIQNVNYMAITAHFIDDGWNVHKRIINFCQIINHSGDAIGRLLERCLRDWGIDRVFTITLDNATSNDGVVRHMNRKLNGWNTLLLDGELLHMRCCAHIINLIVCDGLVELHTSIKSIRRACKYTRSSPARLERFRQCLAIEKIDSKGLLPLECKTRWNSTYLLLEAALKVQKAFERLAEEDMDFVSYFSSGDDYCEKPRNKKRRVEGGEKEKVEIPCATDWLYAKAFVKFLKKFYEATLKFSCYQKVTANAPFQEMFKIVEDLKSTMRNGDPFMKKVASSMKLKFDKYWGSIKDVNQVMLVAVALDPHYKLDYITYGLEFLVENSLKADELTLGVRNLLIRLYGAYKNDNPNQPHAYSEVSDENGGIGNEEGSDPLLDGFMKRRKEKDVVHITNEVDKYLAEASENPKNLAFNLLKWWKENSSRFPILSKVARDVFAFPVSSVASKAAFSAGKRVVDPFRACLTPKTVEALICTNDCLKPMLLTFLKSSRRMK